MNDQKNLILAIAVSVVIMVGFQFFFEGPRKERELALQQQQAQQQTTQPASPTAPAQPPATPGTPAQSGDATLPQVPGAAPGPATSGPTASAPTASAPGSVAPTATAPRITVETPRIHGSISLLGGRIDQVTLSDYRVTIDPDSPPIVLFSPAGTENPYFAQFGWLPQDRSIPVPGPDTRWQTNDQKLTPTTPITLTWDNGQGLRFVRTYAVDDNYMFTITQRVENTGTAPVALYAYALISRTGQPPTSGYYLLHEGPVGVFNGRLQEPSYKDIQDKPLTGESTGGWLGITDKYWLAAVIPDQKAKVNARFLHSREGTTNKYQADWLGEQVTVAPGGSVENTSRLFSGAKEVKLLDAYTSNLGIDRLDLAIDFGWFWFLTKPFFYVLAWFHSVLGNFGLAIFAVTIIVKALFFPLANKSYRSMSAMKKLQPEMLKLRERYKDDKAKLNTEMMALYKRMKVNPASGCLPIVVQIPVFFALYKVLFISIEMRHAPFYGWIKDLSAPDPTNIFNLFGLVAFDPTTLPVIGHFLHLGVWPLIMGITMWLQMQLNPQQPDPVQQQIFSWMPVLFTFLLASFPAGLVIYWAWSNVLSLSQQYFIMRRQGADIHLMGNLSRQFKPVASMAGRGADAIKRRRNGKAKSE
jgi:YidC/Oxa1 family membrane protein insertase